MIVVVEKISAFGAGDFDGKRGNFNTSLEKAALLALAHA
jgi:hypothetical protein